MKREFNLKLRYWLDQNEVNSNKSLTGTSREVFLLLYEFRTLEKIKRLKHPENYHLKFNPKIAKTLAFCVLSMPDDFLSSYVHSFDIYRKYLTVARNHKFVDYEYHDLSEHDCLMLDLLFSLFSDKDYTQKMAYVTKKHNFIGNKQLITLCTTNDFANFDVCATLNHLQNPIDITVDQDICTMTDGTSACTCRLHQKMLKEI